MKERMPDDREGERERGKEGERERERATQKQREGLSCMHGLESTREGKTEGKRKRE